MKTAKVVPAEDNRRIKRLESRRKRLYTLLASAKRSLAAYERAEKLASELKSREVVG